MNAAKEQGYGYEFAFPRHDTLIWVEETGGGITVHATRDTFSAEHKAAFLRELALEGFIPEEYQWAAGLEGWGRFRIHWVIDYSWLKISETLLKRVRRLMIGLFLSVATLWAILMSLLFFSA